VSPGTAVLFLAALAAVLAGVAVHVSVRKTAWRFVVVPFVELIVFSAVVALWVVATRHDDG